MDTKDKETGLYEYFDGDVEKHKKDKYQIIQEILDCMKEKNICNFSELIEYSCKNNYSWFKFICDNFEIFAEYCERKEKKMK